LILQARFAEVIQLSKKILATKETDSAEAAELVWGVALSLEGADLEEATHHLMAAQKLWQAGNSSSLPDLAQIQFELGSVAAQQGNLEKAISFYRQSLATSLESDKDDIIDQRILAYNNLAYHLLLYGDASAEEYAQAGLRLSQEKGSVGLQPYLYSTLGEIALANDDLHGAETNFNTGLAIAERLAIPERIAGLTANLGLVAMRQGKTTLAIHRLSTALAKASVLGTRHLAAQICIWLVPLLPPEEAHLRLSEARAIAESSGRRRLLAEIERLEREISK
jgi:tetratricopeptide (TPR) repeat protein